MRIAERVPSELLLRISMLGGLFAFAIAWLVTNPVALLGALALKAELHDALRASRDSSARRAPSSRSMSRRATSASPMQSTNATRAAGQ